MRKVVQQRVGGPEVLEIREVEVPRPGPGEVLVRVGGVGVNRADVAVRAGYWPILGEPPFTVGWDVAGMVERVGDGVTAFAPGDRVFALARFPREAATYAEFVVVPADELARTPDALTDVEAGALPLAGLTAWLGLVEVAGVSAGQRVLIRAAGGGVGHLAVQIAKARGAHVVAVVSPAKADFVKSIGADEIVDYTAGPFVDDVTPVDVAFDPFGSPDTQTVLPIVKPGGVVVALLDVDEEARAEADRLGVRLERIHVEPHSEYVAQLAALAAAGQLRPHVSATFPLEKAGDAHAALADRAPGKVVVVP